MHICMWICWNSSLTASWTCLKEFLILWNAGESLGVPPVPPLCCISGSTNLLSLSEYFHLQVLFAFSSRVATVRWASFEPTTRSCQRGWNPSQGIEMMSQILTWPLTCCHFQSNSVQSSIGHVWPTNWPDAVMTLVAWNDLDDVSLYMTTGKRTLVLWRGFLF